FSGVFGELRDRLREEGADPGELRRIEDDYTRLSTRAPIEQFRGWADVVGRLHGLRVSRLTREARQALELAAIRLEAGRTDELRRRVDEATATVDRGQAAAALERLHGELVAAVGPSPKGLREVARDWIQRLTGEREQPL